MYAAHAELFSCLVKLLNHHFGDCALGGGVLHVLSSLRVEFTLKICSGCYSIFYTDI